MELSMKKLIIKHSTACIIFLVCSMLLSISICQYFVRKAMIADYNAVVGKVYTEDRTLAEKVAEHLYSNDLTEENLAAGSEAMRELGYTEQGMFLAKTFDVKLYRITGAILLVLVLLLLLILYLKRDKEAVLLAEVKVRIADDILHSNLGEQQLLLKKQTMTQTYIENVAHQVRTPLANAMLNIGLVYEKQSEGDKEVLDECTYHIERVNKLMERLLKIGRLEAGRVEFAKQQENPVELFRELKKQYPENQVKMQLQDTELFFDYEWLYEAFSCLIENCLDHVGAECEVQIDLTATAELAVITVEDNGTGFKEEDIPYLFERFYSSDKLKATGHYGIGLNLAKLIVEQHYGKITAYNRSGSGAGFRVELPRYKLK